MTATILPPDPRAYLESFDPEPVEYPGDSAHLTALVGLLWQAHTDHVRDTSAQTPLTVTDLGWTREKAAGVRGAFGAFAADWDDPIMDEYDRLPTKRDEGDQS